MHINDRKEAFSQAYVRAIASVAGLTCSHQDFDRDSVDIAFKSLKAPYVSVEAQLKATSCSNVIHTDEVHFSLPVKNYNDLRCDTILPRILIVLLLPDKLPTDELENPERWITQTSEYLSLQKCAYWINLKGMPETLNQETVTIKIPMNEEHVFKPSTIIQLIESFLTNLEVYNA